MGAGRSKSQRWGGELRSQGIHLLALMVATGSSRLHQWRRWEPRRPEEQTPRRQRGDNNPGRERDDCRSKRVVPTVAGLGSPLPVSLLYFSLSSNPVTLLLLSASPFFCVLFLLQPQTLTWFFLCFLGPHSIYSLSFLNTLPLCGFPFLLLPADFYPSSNFHSCYWEFFLCFVLCFAYRDQTTTTTK